MKKRLPQITGRLFRPGQKPAPTFHEYVNFAEVEARVMAMLTKSIGEQVYQALAKSRDNTVVMRFTAIHDEIIVEPVDLTAPPAAPSP